MILGGFERLPSGDLVPRRAPHTTLDLAELAELAALVEGAEAPAPADADGVRLVCAGA